MTLRLKVFEATTEKYLVLPLLFALQVRGVIFCSNHSPQENVSRELIITAPPASRRRPRLCRSTLGCFPLFATPLPLKQATTGCEGTLTSKRLTAVRFLKWRWKIRRCRPPFHQSRGSIFLQNSGEKTDASLHKKNRKLSHCRCAIIVFLIRTPLSETLKNAVTLLEQQFFFF